MSKRENPITAAPPRSAVTDLKDFLHEFAPAQQRRFPMAPLLSGVPVRLAGCFEQGKICDVCLVATADYLARTKHIETLPWGLEADLILDQSTWKSPHGNSTTR
jgi:hypothetical protein